MNIFPIRLLRLMLGVLVLSLMFGCNGDNASFSDQEGSKALVSIEVSPTNPSIALGTSQQFTATGTLSDNTTQDLTQSKNLTWLSSDTAIATISNNPPKNRGLAKGVSIGSVTITATSNSVSGTTTLAVIN